MKGRGSEMPIPHFDKDDKREEYIHKIIEDAIRFGAAFGTWYRSSVPYHQRAGTVLRDGVTRVFVDEVLEAIKKFEELKFDEYTNRGW